MAFAGGATGRHSPSTHSSAAGSPWLPHLQAPVRSDRSGGSRTLLAWHGGRV
jgi:hypothetical protein